MNRSWTPQSHVTTTDTGIVIKIELAGVKPTRWRPAFEADQLCIRAEHEEFGAFELKFAIPPGHSRAKMKVSFTKKYLHVELPRGEDKPFFADFPKNMLIYCKGCDKHFDIVITGKGPANYICAHCGKVQTFDLEALVQQVMEQSQHMPGKKRGRR